MDDTRGWQEQSMPQCKCRQNLPNWAKAEWLTSNEELLWRSGELFRWIKDGELKVRIDKTFPLSAPEAHRYMEGRQTRGKVLLSP
jgi:NADPH:quinone reductase-like Zn-dependent oxidoreductase